VDHLIFSISNRKNNINAFIILFLAAFTFFFRLLSLQIINVGPDEIDYWFAAKRLFSTLPYPEINHRTTRFGIIFPVWLFQKAFSTHPFVYSVVPIALSVIQSIYLYKIGAMLHSRKAGYLAVLFLTLYPYMIRSGSQIRPGIFIVTYMLIAWYYIALYVMNDKNRFRKLVVSAVFLFLAYQSKVTALYFFPGMLLGIYYSKKSIKDVITFALALLLLYLGEHILFWISTGNNLGRAGVILNTHLSSGYEDIVADKSFWGLFDRYLSKWLPTLWKVLFMMYLCATGFTLVWVKKKWVKVFTLISLSFFFFITFAVKSFNPVVPVEAFQNRYFTPVLPIIFLILSVTVFECLSLIGAKDLTEGLSKKPARNYGVITSTLFLLLLAFYSLNQVPGSFRPFYNSLTDLYNHPVVKTFRYHSILNEAFRSGTPMVTFDSHEKKSIMSYKSLDTTNRVFIDYGKQETLEPLRRIMVDNKQVVVLCHNSFYNSDRIKQDIKQGSLIIGLRFKYRMIKGDYSDFVQLAGKETSIYE